MFVKKVLTEDQLHYHLNYMWMRNTNVILRYMWWYHLPPKCDGKNSRRKKREINNFFNITSCYYMVETNKWNSDRGIIWKKKNKKKQTPHISKLEWFKASLQYHTTMLIPDYSNLEIITKFQSFFSSIKSKIFNDFGFLHTNL